VKVRFGSFGSTILAAHSAESGQGVSDLLPTAVRHYLAERYRDRVAPRAPAFARASGYRPREWEVSCQLPADVLAALTSEVARQGVPLACLVEHAAFLYLGDLHSGKVAQLERPSPDEMGPTAEPLGPGADTGA
jgi:hypothetical protein